MHTTNYLDTFIAVAPDCPVDRGTEPPERARPSAVRLAYLLLRERPYEFTSDDVLFAVHAERHAIPAAERDAAREAFLARPQPCLRASDLGKRYGWGVHADGAGLVAVYGVETAEYAALARGIGQHGEPVAVTAAMRSRRRGQPRASR
ncbi:MAG: DUF6157 family protein [Thermoleophilia bacterium]